jgi:hypothetical protein
MFAKRGALIAILLLSAVLATACVPKIPMFGTNPQVSPTPPAAASATPVAAATAPAVTPIPNAVVVSEPRGPYPEGEDPVLGTTHWGTRSDRVHDARGQAKTSDPHTAVESFESDLLTEQQSDQLLDIFSESGGVHRLIREYGGKTCQTHYYVKEIQADEDVPGNDTPWVTATLRADFPAPEGLRGIEMQVYRKKITAHKLGLTPYVASTQVSYVDSVGELSRDPGYAAGYKPAKKGATDGLDTIRFRN